MIKESTLFSANIIKLITDFSWFLIITLFHSAISWQLIAGLIGPPLPYLSEKAIRLLIVVGFSMLITVVFEVFHPKKTCWYKFVFLILGLYGMGILYFSTTRVFLLAYSITPTMFYFIIFSSAIFCIFGFWNGSIGVSLKRLTITSILFFGFYVSIFWHAQLGGIGTSILSPSIPSQPPCIEENCFEDFHPKQNEFTFGWIDTLSSIVVKFSHFDDGNYFIAFRYVITQAKDSKQFILLDKKWKLSTHEGKYILDHIESSGFWDLMQMDINSDGLDGYNMYFAAQRNQQLHTLNCWEPTISWQTLDEKEAKLRLLKLAITFLKITNLKIPKRTFYTGLTPNVMQPHRP